MLERIVGSTLTSSNIHEVIDDNSNCYRGMMVNAMIINHGYSSEGLCVDKELNVDATRFFKLLKDSDELLWNECTNYSKLSVIIRMFII
jgi:hypothetical protein